MRTWRRPHTLAAGCVLAAASSLLAPAAVADGGRYDWPLAPQPEVTEPFDPPERPWLPGHRGVDLAATDGDVARAAGDGVVAFAGDVAGKPVVSIDHGAIRTTYEPVVATVSAGDEVRLGDPIGEVQAGHPGCAAPACLHWGARRGEAYLDPLSLLQARVVRLLPI